MGRDWLEARITPRKVIVADIELIEMEMQIEGQIAKMEKMEKLGQ